MLHADRCCNTFENDMKLKVKSRYIVVWVRCSTLRLFLRGCAEGAGWLSMVGNPSTIIPEPYHHQWVTETNDDVIKWKHFPRYWPFVRGIHRSPVNSPHKGQWRGALMLSLICAWKKNGWVNNRKAGDFRRHHAHYDVIVMSYRFTKADRARSSHLLPWINIMIGSRLNSTIHDHQKAMTFCTYNTKNFVLGGGPRLYRFASGEWKWRKLNPTIYIHGCVLL